MIQGRADIDLSREGVREALDLHEKLKDEPFDRAYASELVRARHTAEIILKGRNIPLAIDPRLNEIDQGEWTGKSGRELFLNSERYRIWATRPMQAHPPGGETFQQIADRAASFLRDAQGEYPLIVAHGGIIAVLRATAGEAPLDQAWGLLPKNAQVVRIEWKVKNQKPVA